MPRKSGGSDALGLQGVIGHNILSNNCIASFPSTESVFYIAGSVVVRYSPAEDDQKAFYPSDKAVSCLTVSRDGRYVAIGERGHNPCVNVWDVVKEEKIAVLEGHKHGIGALAFSNSGKYLVSVGFKPDKQLLIWDWKEQKKLSTQKLVNKVHAISFQEDDAYFVTAGDRHLKWWYLTEVLDGEALGVEGKPASIIEEHRLSVFVDVICGTNQYDGKVYTTTASGLLCVFNEERAVDKWIQLESKTSYALELFSVTGADGLLTVGCSSGVIRAFSPKTLAYIATLPLPPPMAGRHSAAGSADAAVFPAVYSLTKVFPPLSIPSRDPRYSDNPKQTLPKLCAVYADRSLIIWDVCDIFRAEIYREQHFHHSCIWDVQFLPAAEENIGVAGSGVQGFVTCSADNSIRLWNADSRSSLSRPASRRTDAASASASRWKCKVLQVEDPSHGHEAGHGSFIGDGPSVIASTATGLSITHSRAVVDFDFAEGLPDFEIPDKPQSAYFPRAIALHPDHEQIACGDKSGKLRIFNLRMMHEVFTIQAHAAEILAVAFSPILVSTDYGQTWTVDNGSAVPDDEDEQRMVLLATAGRDRLIHVFECPISGDHHLSATQQYTCIETLDHHSASVTCVAFTVDGSKLISCGGDKTMVFYQLHGRSLQAVKTIQTPLGTINGLTVDVSNKFVVTSGQDKRLNIWNLHSGKHMRAYRNPEMNVELYKTDLDPSGSYIVTCGFDKKITLMDFFSGEVITQVYGHSELITNVAFSRDGSTVVSVGGDGIILVWKVNEYLVKTMQDRLLELYAIAQRRNQKRHQEAQRLPASAHHVDMPAPSPTGADMPLMPPPPPSMAMEREVHGSHAQTDQIASSLASLKLKQTDRSSTGGSTTKRVSRWRAGGVGGLQGSVEQSLQSVPEAEPIYELHGRKVVADKHSKLANLNKFTLELTGDVLAAEKTWRPPASGSSVGADVHSGAGAVASSIDVDDTAQAARLLSSGAVRNIEDHDDVLQVHHTGDDDANDVEGLLEPEDTDDEEDDGEHLFLPRGDSPAALSGKDEAHADAVLSTTQDRILSLQDTLRGIEDWLESKLKSDAALDPSPEAMFSPPQADQPPATGSTAQDTSVAETGDLDLSRSISAAFFLQKKTPAASASAPVVAVGDSVDAGRAYKRRRENPLQVSHMEERLRAMGVAHNSPAAALQSRTETTTSESVEQPHVPLTAAFPPPPPPPLESSTELSREKERQQAPLTSSRDRAAVVDTVNQHGSATFSGTTTASAAILQQQLKEKHDYYLSVLRDLDAAKEKAARSFQELEQLRSSILETSTAFPVGATAGSVGASVSLESSAVLDEADLLLARFRQSLGTFAPSSQRDQVRLELQQSWKSSLDESMVSQVLLDSTVRDANATSSSRSSSGAGRTTEPRPADEHVAAILERYSDRLVDIVGEKLLSRLAASQTGLPSPPSGPK